MRFISFKGTSDAICGQKIKERGYSPTARSSAFSAADSGDCATADAFPSETLVHRTLAHSEEICDSLFEMFDRYLEYYWEFVEGAFDRPWTAKGREETIRTAQAVVGFMRKREDKRLKQLFFVFVLLLGCLMLTVLWTRFARSNQADLVRPDRR